MTKYAVWSTHVPEEGEPHDELEVTRTDKGVANSDRAIIQEIFHRKSWIQENAFGCSKKGVS